MKALAFSGGKDSMACLHLLRGQLDCAIYVDTGFAYPETQALVDYAASLVPMHVVKSERAAQNEREGIPSDVVPVDWTVAGQEATHSKNCRVQSYMECCYQNIARPLFVKAQELGVTELVYGQRGNEGHRSSAKDGDMVLGIIRRQPIEDWTEAEVLAYLASKMEVPAHYKIKHSSLDCYDCTAFRNDSADRIAYTREKHPIFFVKYAKRAELLDGALSQALCR
jgi:3'-phosphoadenosine 5'-phosphosulfate sulfotransferase (PAPS reductase)/FAD synthetase